MRPSLSSVVPVVSHSKDDGSGQHDGEVARPEHPMSVCVSAFSYRAGVPIK